MSVVRGRPVIEGSLPAPNTRKPDF